MKKLLFLALPLVLIGCNNKAENYIRISSTESVDVPVSYAEISIGISNHENDLKKLDSTSHLKLVKILSIIRKYGIKDISTENSTMETEYENKNNLTMSQSYLVKMRDLTKIDGFRNELVNVGCNVFKINNYGSDSLAKYEQQVSDETTPALHKNVIELEAKSSSFCQIVDIRGEKFFDVLICADRKCGHTTGLREPTGPVDDVSTDSTDMMEGPKLYTFESGISLSVGSGHLELAA